MIRSEMLTPYLVVPSQERKKEERLEKSLQEMKELPSYTVDMLFTPAKKIKFLMELCRNSVSVFILTMGIIYLCTFKLSDYSTKALIGVSLFMAFFTLFINWRTSYGGMQEIAKFSAEKFHNQVKELFLSIADKNYEIRTELIEENTKMKIIVEENEYIEGTNSVIKAKPKSMTAYMNSTASKEEIVKTMISLVKAVETRFN